MNAPFEIRQMVKRAYDDGIIGIVASNFVTICMALFNDWNLYFLLSGFWFQNIIHGAFNALRMHHLERFSTDKILYQGKPVEPTVETRRKLTVFFMLHYGFFHLIYAILISVFWTVSKTPFGVTITDFLLVIAPFLASSVIEHGKNLACDRERTIHIGHLFLFPYARILPMHITVITALILGSKAVFLFLILKTIADVLMQIIDVRLSRPDRGKTFPIQIG